MIAIMNIFQKMEERMRFSRNLESVFLKNQTGRIEQ